MPGSCMCLVVSCCVTLRTCAAKPHMHICTDERLLRTGLPIGFAFEAATHEAQPQVGTIEKLATRVAGQLALHE